VCLPLIMSFAKEAWPFVLPFVVAAAVLLLTDWKRTAICLLLVGIGVLLFFRIPRRPSSGDDPSLLAPACGRVTRIEPATEPLMGAESQTRIVTFLSVFDVHVQRAPARGKVIATEFRAGRKVAAFRQDAGDINESRLTVLELPSGDRIGVRQIAGLLARRVVGYLEKGDSVERGALMGVIKFGSRVDLMIPQSYEVLVSEGQKVQEGLTVIARPGADSR
jgi:phosphatidylserine decarboxylase